MFYWLARGWWFWFTAWSWIPPFFLNFNLIQWHVLVLLFPSVHFFKPLTFRVSRKCLYLYIWWIYTYTLDFFSLGRTLKALTFLLTACFPSVIRRIIFSVMPFASMTLRCACCSHKKRKSSATFKFSWCFIEKTSLVKRKNALAADKSINWRADRPSAYLDSNHPQGYFSVSCFWLQAILSV